MNTSQKEALKTGGKAAAQSLKKTSGRKWYIRILIALVAAASAVLGIKVAQEVDASTNPPAAEQPAER